MERRRVAPHSGTTGRTGARREPHPGSFPSRHRRAGLLVCRKPLRFSMATGEPGACRLGGSGQAQKRIPDSRNGMRGTVRDCHVLRRGGRLYFFSGSGLCVSVFTISASSVSASLSSWVIGCEFVQRGSVFCNATRMRDRAAHACRALCRARVVEEIQDARERGSQTISDRR
jgi:hypothetical protein